MNFYYFFIIPLTNITLLSMEKSAFWSNFGILLNKVDLDLLEDAMIRILNNEIKSSKIEISNYAKQIFSKQKIAEQFSEIYNKVLTKW